MTSAGKLNRCGQYRRRGSTAAGWANGKGICGCKLAFNGQTARDGSTALPSPFICDSNGFARFISLSAKHGDPAGSSCGGTMTLLFGAGFPTHRRKSPAKVAAYGSRSMARPSQPPGPKYFSGRWAKDGHCATAVPPYSLHGQNQASRPENEPGSQRRMAASVA